ncbi:MAG TPA: UPF0149 family protein [Chloroflexota bacterium]|nr:UPF0149 family protein [Chloroflexota bacterium]
MDSFDLPHQRGPALNQALTDAEYDCLEAILARFPGEEAMDLEAMDGFFAALICGPVTIPPSVYLEEIWGGGEAPFLTSSDFQEFLSLAMRHWNFTTRSLASPDLIFLAQLGLEPGEDIPRANDWARGFMRGVDLSHEAWQEIFEDEEGFALLFPILALAHEDDPDPELRSWETPPDAGLRKHLMISVSVSAQQLYDYFRPHRVRAARVESSRFRTAPKIGRNDPCGCGSGKKYKRCCGSVTIH